MLRNLIKAIIRNKKPNNELIIASPDELIFKYQYLPHSEVSYEQLYRNSRKSIPISDDEDTLETESAQSIRLEDFELLSLDSSLMSAADKMKSDEIMNSLQETELLSEFFKKTQENKSLIYDEIENINKQTKM